MRTVLALVFALAGLAVVAQPAPAASRSRAPVMTKAAKRGLAFAQDHCSACHALQFNQSSTNPESPPFPDIANRPGLTEATLRSFLRDSHNYPEAMQFTVDKARIRDLAAYVVTLKRAGYKPEI